MKFFIDEIPVYFPFNYIYPEQYAYMKRMKQAIDAGGSCIFEMPSGTGKTVTLLCLAMGYQQIYPERVKKIIYCSRTVAEIEKVLNEAKVVLDYKERIMKEEMGESGNDWKMNYLCLGLTSRRNLCLHPTIKQEKEGAVVDSMCRDLTASFIRQKAKQDPSIPTCEFFEKITQDAPSIALNGVFTIDDLRSLGNQQHWCPYFLSRKMFPQAHMIVYSYQYVIDPKIAGEVSKDFPSNSLLIFDEAHNIDNVCVESLSINITRKTLDFASDNIKSLNELIVE